eukprot:gene24011-9584_t
MLTGRNRFGKRTAPPDQTRGGISQPRGYTLEDAPVKPVPLKSVVDEAVQRWFDETYMEAQRGDLKQQAMLGQMYAEGYGCEKNMEEANEWIAKAAARGYKMDGVYCFI